MDSWSGNCPVDPLPLPLPFHVDTCAGLEDHVRPPSLERLANRAIWNGGVRVNARQTKEAGPPSGAKPTARAPPTPKAPLPGPAGSVRELGGARREARGNGGRP